MTVAACVHANAEAARPTQVGGAVPPAASQPTTKPFQPGVLIDWRNRAVLVQTRVVLRRAPLEFLACWSGKEHESILRIEAAAEHVYLALGLLGLQPGHPPAWDETLNDYRPAAGDLVEIGCVWEQDGQWRTADACEWLREIEYARTPIPRPWVFAGSVRLPDGSLAAGRSGVGIAVVDFSDSLLSLSCGHTSRNAELWVEANTEAIPPQGTPVQLVFRPARPRPLAVMLDFRGQTFIGGRFASLADLADLLALGRQLDPQCVQTISVVGALSSDVRRVRRELAERGVPPEAVCFAPQPTGPS